MVIDNDDETSIPEPRVVKINGKKGRPFPGGKKSQNIAIKYKNYGKNVF